MKRGWGRVLCAEGLCGQRLVGEEGTVPAENFRGRGYSQVCVVPLSEGVVAARPLPAEPSSAEAATRAFHN